MSNVQAHTGKAAARANRDRDDDFDDDLDVEEDVLDSVEVEEDEEAGRDGAEKRSRSLLAIELERERDLAAAGVSDQGRPLPFGDEIQSGFGRHDVSGVRAHDDANAREAAEELDAHAYAHGQDVAFGTPPDLHTAAHEAAHTVQQREGVALRARGADDGDAMEAHADRVADAIVQGKSAEPILDEVAASSGSKQSAEPPSVQLKGKGKKQKPRADRDYSASWDDVASAADGKQASVDKLDVEWIDGLDPYVIKEIDRQFSETLVEQQFNEKFSKDEKKLNAAFKSDVKKLKEAAKDRLKAAGVKKPKTKDIDEEPEFVVALKERKHKLDQERLVMPAAERDAFDEQKVKPNAPMYVTAPPKEGVTRVEGRMLARADFMSWGVLVLGSVDALKAHYKEIHEVPGTSGMFLHKAASDRYVAARTWFESKYPGYTFLSTDVAMQMRNRHQEGHPKGKMGHPLGNSADFKAYENPNQLGDGGSQYMLRRFGGADEDTPGANQINTKGNPWEMTEAIGQATANGTQLSKKQLAYLDSVEAGYNEMAATSTRFKASRADEMPALRGAEALWFEKGMPALNALKSAEAKLEKAREGAEKRLKKELKGLGEQEQQEMIDSDDKVAAAIDVRDAAQDVFDAIKDEVTAVMQAVFEPWVTGLQAEVDASMVDIDPAHLDLEVSVDQVDEILGKVKKAKKHKNLTDLIAKYEKAFSAFDTSGLPEDVTEARALIASYLTSVRAARWSSGEISVKLELIRRLTKSPMAVFGAESVRDKKSGRTKHKPKVSGPTVMQYLEDGFVRHDDMPEKKNAKVGGESAKGVFNGEFIKCMTMHGFNTLATWRGVDTMHFDFVEGNSKAEDHEFYSP